MSLKTSFLDDEMYGASDVNAITARLVGPGVLSALFADGERYNLSGLNDITKSVVERGVAYEDDTALKVIKDGSLYYIQPGTCFFGNGSVSELTEAEEVTPAVGTTSYIYMVSSESLGTNYIEVSEEYPDYENDSNIVPLASVDTDGNITDMRFYARAKLPCVQNVAATVKTISISADSLNDAQESKSGNGYYWYKYTADVDMEVDRIYTIIDLEHFGIMILNGSTPIFYNATSSSNSVDLMGLYFGKHTAAPELITNAEYVSGTKWRLTLWAHTRKAISCNFLCIG